jgi:hypothetical protein
VRNNARKAARPFTCCDKLGEANNLRIRDLEAFEDDLERRNYRFKVEGKTGERDVILRASAAKSVDRLLTRRAGARPNDWLFVMGDGSQVVTLIDQFDKALALAGVTENSHGDKYTLYSLRHFYACSHCVEALVCSM